MTPGYEARLKGIEYKASEAFLQALQNYANVVGAGRHAIQRHSVSGPRFDHRGANEIEVLQL